MSDLQLTIPALFGDHHTVAVKEILDKLDGIESTFVTSAYRQVVIKFDPEKTSEEAIKETLARAGYQEGPLEEDFSESSLMDSTRHTASVTEILSFVNQPPSWEGRPLWPCPGLEYKTEMED